MFHLSNKFVHSFKLNRSLVRPNIARFLSNDDTVPPKPPINFGKDFAIPPFSSKLLLEELNPHPVDAKIGFNATGHKYTYDNVVMNRSVTELVGECFPKFDEDLIIQKMITGDNWPRDGYVNKKTNKPFNEKEIKRKWASVGDFAANAGTWMHYNIERYFNNLAPAINLPEMEQFLKFKEEIIEKNNITPYRTEWRIAAPDLSLAGSIDFVGLLPDGTYVLMDWKRSKDLHFKLQNGYNKKALYPIELIDDCDGMKYFLQLNIYK